MRRRPRRLHRHLPRKIRSKPGRPRRRPLRLPPIKRQAKHIKRRPNLHLHIPKGKPIPKSKPIHKGRPILKAKPTFRQASSRKATQPRANSPRFRKAIATPRKRQRNLHIHLDPHILHRVLRLHMRLNIRLSPRQILTRLCEQHRVITKVSKRKPSLAARRARQPPHRRVDPFSLMGLIIPAARHHRSLIQDLRKLNARPNPGVALRRL